MFAASSSNTQTHSCSCHPLIVMSAWPTVRRQMARPFGRSSVKEEAVIRARFEIYMAMPMRKIETMRPVATAVDEVVAALFLERAGRRYSKSR